MYEEFNQGGVVSTPTQGNDPRMNSEKPESSFQMLSNETGNLLVCLGEEENSPLYYEGPAAGYKGGATHRDDLPEDFIGDPENEVNPETKADQENQ